MLKLNGYGVHHTPEEERKKGSRANEMSFVKKRIGNYAYYLNEQIGSGYSSRVYKCHKNDSKSQVFAIKVIKLVKMSKENYGLLQNQIKILQQLDHPNIIKFHDVYYTPNNCYIITDYCEASTLQTHIDSNHKLKWEQIFLQIWEGLKYLSSNLIIHRDIKPANIFLKGHLWKIGDFGFSRFISHREAQVKEIYMIGSPLYMPPETLQKNIYSLKTDSFALGILMFHLITKTFPWSGSNRKQLLENYAQKKFPLQEISHIPKYFQSFIQGLCEIQISRRLYVEDFNGFEAKQLITKMSSLDDENIVAQFAREMKLDIVAKVKLAKFVYYINANIQHFAELTEISESLRKILKFFAVVFNWCDNLSMSKFLDEFMCRNYEQFSSISSFIKFNIALERQIEQLKGTQIRRCQVLRVKMIQLSAIIRCLVAKNFTKLQQLISTLTLHPDFNIFISNSQISAIQELRNIMV